MSATSAPFGFRPSYHNSGRITAKAYVIASGYAQNVFQGDPVKLTDNGVVQLATSDGTRSGSAGGVKILGIFAGVQYQGTGGRPELSPYWPASVAGTEIICWVYDDPAILYDVMYTNPSSGTTIQASIGKQADWTVASPGGSTQVGLSTTSLTVLQGTSGQFQITGVAGGADNALTDAYVDVTVRINEMQYNAAVNTIS